MRPSWSSRAQRKKLDQHLAGRDVTVSAKDAYQKRRDALLLIYEAPLFANPESVESLANFRERLQEVETASGKPPEEWWALAHTIGEVADELTRHARDELDYEPLNEEDD